MAEPLTPEQLTQVWELVWSKLQANGVDYEAELIAPATPEEWAKIRIIVKDERDLDHIKECNIDLKKAFDAYGVDVRLVADTVKASESRIDGAKTIVVEAEASVNRSVAHIDEVAGTVESARSEAVSSASAASASAGNAGTSESNASASATAAARDAETASAKLVEMQGVQAQISADKTDITVMKDSVERIYQEAQRGSVYGVDFNMVTGAATRIDSAVGMDYRKHIGGAGSAPAPVGNSFMLVGPWANIYQTLRTVDGNTLMARTGDANFEEMLRSGTCNLFTCIPRYWIKMETPVIDGQSHWIIHVSASPFAGAFSVIDGDSVEIASLVTGSKDGKHVSQPGAIPLVNTSCNTFESKAEQQGLYNSSWQDFLAWWILMLVQTADLNSQRAVGDGCSSTLASWGGEAIKVVEERVSSNEIVMSKWNNYTPGMTVYINSASSSWYGGGLGIRNITNVAPHPSNTGWVVLTVDGEPLTTAVGDWCAGCAQRTDIQAVLDMGLDCGYWKPSDTAVSSVCHAFVYGICDPWANVFQAASGICKHADKLYLASGRQKQPGSLPATGWVEADDFAWISEGWAKKWRIKQSASSISLVPIEMGGNSGTLFGDYTWGAADNVRIAWRGGRFIDGSTGGALSVDWLPASDSYISCGARLAYQK